MRYCLPFRIETAQRYGCKDCAEIVGYTLADGATDRHHTCLSLYAPLSQFNLTRAFSNPYLLLAYSRKELRK